jgi:hypothetical protein
VIGDQTDEVVIGRESDAAMFISKPRMEPHGYARVPIRLVAGGVAASGVLQLEEWSGGLPRLPAFFDELAAGWRGWAGTMEWGDDGATCEMSASHDGKGLVLLHAALRSLPYDAPGTWKLTVEVPIEPGALGAIAQRIRLLVGTTG